MSDSKKPNFKKTSTELFDENEDDNSSDEDKTIEEFLNTDNYSNVIKNNKDKVVESYKNRYFRYDILMGSGSFKKVYKCFDQEEGLEVAWCIVDFGALSESTKKRVRNEFRVWKSISHSSIVSLYDTWFDKKDDKVVFITEMFDSGNLRQFMKEKGPQRLGTIKKWACKILEAIAFLHDNNITHRDIKSDNVYINKNGIVKIGDYGLASKQSTLVSIVGTPVYMAPEVLHNNQNEDGYTKKCDIWSYGLMVLEIVTNESPYQELTSIIDIMSSKEKTTLPYSLFKVSDYETFSFIASCLIPDSNYRPTAEDLLKSQFLTNKDTATDKCAVKCDYMVYKYSDVEKLWKDLYNYETPEGLHKYFLEQDILLEEMNPDQQSYPQSPILQKKSVIDVKLDNRFENYSLKGIENQEKINSIDVTLTNNQNRFDNYSFNRCNTIEDRNDTEISTHRSHNSYNLSSIDNHDNHDDSHDHDETLSTEGSEPKFFTYYKQNECENYEVQKYLMSNMQAIHKHFNMPFDANLCKQFITIMNNSNQNGINTLDNNYENTHRKSIEKSDERVIKDICNIDNDDLKKMEQHKAINEKVGYSKILSDFLDLPTEIEKQDINNEMRTISFPINKDHLHSNSDKSLVQILKHRLNLVCKNVDVDDETEWNCDNDKILKAFYKMNKEYLRGKWNHIFREDWKYLYDEYQSKKEKESKKDGK